MESERSSPYDTLPGNIPVLTKPTAIIRTQKFIYANQFATSTQTTRNPLGKANLAMAWAIDPDSGQKGGAYDIDLKTPIASIPRQRYVLSTLGSPYVFAYDNYYVIINRNDFVIVMNATFGPVGETFEEYVRVTIFNDSFDGPFVRPEVL